MSHNYALKKIKIVHTRLVIFPIVFIVMKWIRISIFLFIKFSQNVTLSSRICYQSKKNAIIKK